MRISAVLFYVYSMLTFSFIVVSFLFQYVCILNIQKYQHHHKTAVATKFSGEYDLPIDCVFVSFCICTIAFFIYANLLLHFHFYCITVCSSREYNIYRGKTIIITYQHWQHYMVGHIYIYQLNLYFCICFHPSYWFYVFMLTHSFIDVIIALWNFRHVYQ